MAERSEGKGRADQIPTEYTPRLDVIVFRVPDDRLNDRGAVFLDQLADAPR
jgi:hypothetical protein